jgi:hypothetical protein
MRVAATGPKLCRHALPSNATIAWAGACRMLWVRRGERTIECIVAKDDVEKREKSFVPFLLGLTKIFHFIDGLADAEQSADGNDEGINQIVVQCAADARNVLVYEKFDQGESGMRVVHPSSSIPLIADFRGFSGGGVASKRDGKCLMAR